jgi:hypothetical protein
MAKNRQTQCAPRFLLSLSKATLADLVWQLAATNGACESCDDPEAVAEVIADEMKGSGVRAPTSDRRAVARGLERIARDREASP